MTRLIKTGNITAMTCLILIVLPLLLTATSHMIAASPVLSSLNPTEGFVGDEVKVEGKIDTRGGAYEILWNGNVLKLGNCKEDGKEVSDSFKVPPTTAGIYNVTLRDVKTGEESDPVSFEVKVHFTLTSTPKRIQEDESVTLNISVTGGLSKEKYLFTVKVSPPKGESRTEEVVLYTNDVGNGTGKLVYPEDFPDATTDYVGIYKVNVNSTLIVGNFTVGLTERYTYRRLETVHIKGVGYGSYESVIVDIKRYEASVEGFPHRINATADGVVLDKWEIPIDQTLGRYIVSIIAASPNGTVKLIGDTQEFEVTRAIFDCRVQVVDLTNKPLTDITVKAYNVTSGKEVQDQSLNESGWCVFSLDAWNYTFRAFHRDVNVGELQNIALLNTTTLSLKAELGNILVKVTTEDKKPLPMVKVNFIYNYTTTENETLSRNREYWTDLDGMAIMDYAYPHLNYTLEFRRYDILFQTLNITDLPLQPWTNLTVTCPNYNLNLEVVDSKLNPLTNLKVNLTDIGSEVQVGHGRTDNNGKITLRLTLGKYRIEVYDYNEEFNRVLTYNVTIVDLVEDEQTFQVKCKGYNLNAYLQIIDYFGQPVPSAIVRITYRDSSLERTTDSNGVISLPKVGGEYTLSVYKDGRLLDMKPIKVDKSGGYTIKIDNIVIIGGYPIELIQFISIISILATLLLLSLAMIYRRLLSKKLSVIQRYLEKI